jgi:hypothetical protein
VAPRFLRESEQRRIEILVHESWHVYEMQNNVHQNPLILEGTAVASERLAGRADTPLEGTWPGWIKILYDGAAQVTHRWMRAHGANYPDLLIPENRAAIEQSFVEYLATDVQERFPAIIHTPEYLRDEFEIVKDEPIFKEMFASPKGLKLLYPYKYYGGTTIADEIFRTDPAVIERRYEQLLANMSTPTEKVA